MLDWTSGAPNARFDALRLLVRTMPPGCTLVATKILPHDHNIDSLAFDANGTHRLLIVNRRNRIIPVQVPDEFVHGAVHAVAPQQQPATLTTPRISPTAFRRGGPGNAP